MFANVFSARILHVYSVRICLFVSARRKETGGKEVETKEIVFVRQNCMRLSANARLLPPARARRIAVWTHSRARVKQLRARGSDGRLTPTRTFMFIVRAHRVKGSGGNIYSDDDVAIFHTYVHGKASQVCHTAAGQQYITDHVYQRIVQHHSVLGPAILLAAQAAQQRFRPVRGNGDDTMTNMHTSCALSRARKAHTKT